MAGFHKKRCFLSLFLLLAVVVHIPLASCCKDIVVTAPATVGDYNLLLKIRDPSRPGLQILCRVPKGTMYTYHYPWTGKPWDFVVNHTFIGVATKGDTLPNIVKAGMTLSDVGLAFGDADTGSNWINPTKHAWDDFDWIRFACQSADTLENATTLLTTEAVNRLHATGVSENLFVVSPQDAVVIEADAVHYTTTSVQGVLVMSNYPKDLWRTQILKLRPVASSFDATKEPWVRQGSIIHLGSFCGVKITQINDNYITVKAFPSFVFRLYGQDQEVTLSKEERGNVGPYSVRLFDIQENKAQVSVCTLVNAWEQELLRHIQPAVGHITVQTMMNLSRLHTEDLDFLRPMCEDMFTYEAALICQLPQEHANILGCAWFSANHACSSIYVPVHICDTDIYDPYENGDAAARSLDLLSTYGHGSLTKACQQVETVFIGENNDFETLAGDWIDQEKNVSAFYTSMDTGMQHQAWLTEHLWLPTTESNHENISKLIMGIWENNYTVSLKNMGDAVCLLNTMPGSTEVIDILTTIACNICQTRITMARSIGNNMTALEETYHKGTTYITTGDYEKGFDYLQNAFHQSTIVIKGGKHLVILDPGITTKNNDMGLAPVIVMLLLIVTAVFAVFLKKLQIRSK